MLNANVILPRCLKTSTQEKSQLWHNRYAHLSIKGLNTLVKKNMVKGLPDLEEIEEKCADCLTGKQHRNPIPKQTNWRASSKLELVHSDICGPLNPTSNGGNRYFITFTDDLTRKTWIYFMKEKSSALDLFKKFKVLVENESGCVIQCLRTDRGGEFTSNDFNMFCSDHGIKRQLTAAYTPQQNGVAERKNRTLMDMVRSMLAGRNVPKVFWPEAIKWATHVMNRSPTLSVKDITPEEAWSGKKPAVHYFRIFGCLAFAHVPDSQRIKMDNKSIKCIHLGVSDESKAYKLYDPIKKKILISRDVVFEENKSWKWNSDGDNKESHEADTVNTEVNNDDDNTNEAVNDIVMNNDGNHEEESNDEELDMNTSSSDDNVVPPRQRRPPPHFKDYVPVPSDESEEDDLHNLAVFVSSKDPKSFEEAEKYDV
jgi:hypothetical protein